MKNNISKEVMDNIYKNIESDNIQKVVVGAVIDMGNDKILLLKRSSDDFMGGLVELPSGTVDRGENLPEALEREVLEETGLIMRSMDAFVGTFDYLSGSGKRTRQVNFKVLVFNDAVKLSCEHEAYYICSPKSAEFQQLNISESTKKIIENTFKTDKLCFQSVDRTKSTLDR